MEENAVLDDISDLLKRFSTLIGEFCPGETPDMGAMILILEDLTEAAKKSGSKTFIEVAEASLGYVSHMTLETMTYTKPLEEALVLLEALYRHQQKGKEFMFETDDVMQILNTSILTAEKKKDPPEPRQAAPAPTEAKAPEGDPEPVSEEDLEILLDFVSEAEENLDAIEVNLIELEQDPSDTEIINNIFRPVHTIKGVAGFLSLKRINQLAHATENLLDAARSGEFLINDLATDAILESVDMLKRMIARVKEGAAKGVRLPDNDLNIAGLRDKLKNIQLQMTQGVKPPIGEILVSQGAIDKISLDEGLESQKSTPDKKLGEILVEKQKVQPSQVAQALMEQRTEKKTIATQVKVNTEKLDDLVDYAGELVIAQSMLRQKVSQDPSLVQSVTHLGQIVSNMQHIAMSMRMISIKATFMKMIRLVRDLSKKSGKPVRLTMSGEETEIDRNVVDALYEPMVHMIRNSVDHGMEPLDVRRSKGKPDKGTIHLSAYHKGGNIIIEIQDDGKGLDRDRILEKGIEKGLVSETDQLTDAQVFDLILKPGFSTAREITDVSGRGVGMDVVKSGIEKFRGHLKIESQKGEGTKFTISLPLTLAIIDGMLVRVGEERYVIPTTAIQRAFKPDKEHCFTVEAKGELIKERDHLIPVVRLKQLYSEDEDRMDIWDGLVVVVESKDEQKALLIDELLGKDEYVIKSLGGNLEGVQGFSGGAILADGRVGLILDIHGVFQLAETI